MEINNEDLLLTFDEGDDDFGGDDSDDSDDTDEDEDEEEGEEYW